MDDLDHVKRLSNGRIDLTIGSALDIFGGSGVNFKDCVEWNLRQISSIWISKFGDSERRRLAQRRNTCLPLPGYVSNWSSILARNATKICTQCVKVYTDGHVNLPIYESTFIVSTPIIKGPICLTPRNQGKVSISSSSLLPGFPFVFWQGVAVKNAGHEGLEVWRYLTSVKL